MREKRMYDLIEQPLGNYHKDDIVADELKKADIMDARRGDSISFIVSLLIPVTNDIAKVKQACNGIFHRLGVLPRTCDLEVGGFSEYCQIEKVTEDGTPFYRAVFNWPYLLSHKDDEFLKAFALHNFRKSGLEISGFRNLCNDEEALDDAIEGIRTGRLRAKDYEGRLILWEDDYDEIAAWRRREIELDFSINNIKRTIGAEAIVLRRGYGAYGEPWPQTRWQISSIKIIDDNEEVHDPCNIPEDCWPIAISVQLGDKINDRGEVFDALGEAAHRFAIEREHQSCDGQGRLLQFSAVDSPDSTSFWGCVGSLGKLQNLNVEIIYGAYVRFILRTDSGEYNLDTRVYEPGLQALRFLRVWRRDVPHEAECQSLLFNPQIVASIEKAGLSFANRFGGYGEIELLDEQAALEYLKNARDFKVDTWPLECGILSRILWCDTNFRPLCERRTDFSMAAEFDHGLWSVLSASHLEDGIGEWGDAAHRAFLGQRYGAYAAIRNGVVPRLEN